MIVRPYATDVGIKPDKTAIRITEKFFRRELDPYGNDSNSAAFRSVFANFPVVNVTRSAVRPERPEDGSYAPFSPAKGKLFMIPPTADAIAYGFVNTPPDMDFLGISPICRM